MKEIYISWSKGLPQSKKALGILKNSGIISGIEMSSIDEQFDMVKDSGLKVCLHNPGRELTLNLAKEDYMDVFNGEQGSRLLYVIKNSDASIVGFHCGYSAEKVYKMRSCSNIPIEKVLTKRNELLKRITNNVISLEKKKFNKQVVLETLDYSRNKPILWEEVHLDEVKAKKDEIEKIIKKYGTNAAILYVTEPLFIKEVLDNTKAGFLFDIGHNIISADTKIYNGEFPGTIKDYFDEMFIASNGRTYQMHLSVPKGNGKEGYSDYHGIFTEDKLSDYVMKLGKEVDRKSPELSVITLEMTTNLTPIKHAKEMIKQTELWLKI